MSDQYAQITEIQEERDRLKEFKEMRERRLISLPKMARQIEYIINDQAAFLKRLEDTYIERYGQI